MGCVQSSSADENEPTERLAAKSVYTRRGSELRYRDFDSYFCTLFSVSLLSQHVLLKPLFA